MDTLDTTAIVSMVQPSNIAANSLMILNISFKSKLKEQMTSILFPLGYKFMTTNIIRKLKVKKVKRRENKNIFHSLRNR